MTGAVSMTATIMSLLNEGPLLAGELPSPIGKLASRIRAVNRFNEHIHSHWRVRGRKVHIICPVTGRRLRSVLYRLVME